MLLLSLISMMCLFALTAVKKITPKSGRFIELSKNNRNMVADYTFHFYLENDSLVGKINLICG